jgi:hypothetical protein
LFFKRRPPGAHRWSPLAGWLLGFNNWPPANPTHSTYIACKRIGRTWIFTWGNQGNVTGKHHLRQKNWRQRIPSERSSLLGLLQFKEPLLAVHFAVHTLYTPCLHLQQEVVSSRPRETRPTRPRRQCHTSPSLARPSVRRRLPRRRSRCLKISRGSWSVRWEPTSTRSMACVMDNGTCFMISVPVFFHRDCIFLAGRDCAPSVQKPAWRAKGLHAQALVFAPTTFCFCPINVYIVVSHTHTKKI